MGSEEGSQRCWALDRLDFGENYLMGILSYLLLSIWFKSPPPSLLNKVFAAIFRL